uniref:EOG090X089S n=1 Tax=Alona affinis TaxID=381656 RepID=A0A9N6ZDL6_9CRUS|nr:EOG090X089S [Alona affinis]
MLLSSFSVLKSVSQYGARVLSNGATLQQQTRLICGMAATVGSSSLLVPRVPLIDQQRHAARKGTRERKTKKKVKNEIVKKEVFVPYKIKLAKLHKPDGPRRVIEIGLPEAIDDVFHMRHFMTRPLLFADAIQFQRESNHPTVYNCPDALITAQIELDMRLEKKNRYLDSFSRLLLMPHQFDYEPPRKILAFCKTSETQEEAIKGGADAAGGPELIKRIQSGEVAVADYDYFVAHTNMMTEVTILRGLLRKKLPNVKSGSLGVDLAKMIERLSKGIEFTATRDAYELDFGLAQMPIGRINMPTEELEANFDSVLKDLESCRGRPVGAFITRCFIVSPPSPERLVVNLEPFLGKQEDSSSSSSDDEDSDDDEADQEGDDRVVTKAASSQG